MENIYKFGAAAAEIAMTAAAEYIGSKYARVDDYDALIEALRRHTRPAVTQGLKDAKEALDAGMPQVAEATFMASMRLAGIAAAKEFLRDDEVEAALSGGLGRG